MTYQVSVGTDHAPVSVSVIKSTEMAAVACSVRHVRHRTAGWSCFSTGSGRSEPRDPSLAI